MSMFMGPPREKIVKALRAIRATEFPMTIGKHSPEAIIREEGDKWIVRTLKMNEEKLAIGAKEGLANGHWMPEMEWRFLEPGDIYLEAPSRGELATLIEKKWRWPF